MKKTVCSLLILSTLLIPLAGCSDDEPETTTTGTSTAADAAVTTEPDPLDALADTDPIFGSQYVYDDYSPYIQAGNLKDITVSRATADKLVEEFMTEVLASFMGINFVDAPADAVLAEGDRATVYYTGYSADPNYTISEETLSGMTNQDAEEGTGLVIGSNAFIPAYESEEHPENNNPGFEEQLIGAKVGDSLTITVTFPDEYGSAPELQGRQVKFDVTIEKIEHPDDPEELTDELVESYTDGLYTTVEELNEFKLNDCKVQLAFEEISGRITVTNYPETEYNELLESYLDYFTNEDISEEDLAALRESGDREVKDIIEEELTLNFLYNYFEIALTKAEYLEKLQASYDENALLYSYYYGIYSAEDLEDYYSRDYLISYYKSEKLSDILAELAVWGE